MIGNARTLGNAVQDAKTPTPRYDKYAGLGHAERAEAMRMESYATHKAHGTLGVHYSLYPEDRPITPMSRPQSHDDERER